MGADDPTIVNPAVYKTRFFNKVTKEYFIGIENNEEI
jgi:hypothetical protein